MNKYNGRVTQKWLGEQRDTIQVLRLPHGMFTKYFSRMFLWYFRRYMNTHTYRLRVRGRKAKVRYGRKRGWKWLDSIPLDQARVLGVYLDNKSEEKALREKWKKAREYTPEPEMFDDLTIKEK